VKKINLGVSMVALSLALVAAPCRADAQTKAEPAASDPAPTADIVVTGIRASLEKATDIKRENNGVVDAITAEDIGKFPDSNLSESLQRITGVSIDRRNGEGNQITVRGFGPSFNLVTLNGRQMPGASSPKSENASSSGIPRSFNFSEIAADSVAGVNVYKTARPELPAGGIGATVDLRTARPFDKKGFRAAFSINGLADRSNAVGKDITPELGGLISKTFLDDRIGILLTGSYSKRQGRERVISTDGWIRGNRSDPSAAGINTSAINPALDPSGSIWVPRNLLFDASDHNRERINGQAVVQVEPVDDLVVTLDYTYSRYRDTISRAQTAVWFQQDTITGRTDANGTVINPTVTANPAGGLGAFDFNSYLDEVETRNNSIGANVTWKVADNFKIALDYHNSTSHAQPNGQSSDFLVIYAGPLGTNYTADFSGTTQVPAFSYTGVNPYNLNALRPNIDLARNNENKNDVEQFQAHLTWDNDGGGALKRIRAGFDHVNYKIATDFQFKLNVQGTPTCGAPCAAISTIVPRGDIGAPFSGGNTLAPSLVVFNAQTAFNLANGTGGTPGRFPSVFSLRFNDFNKIAEKTTAGYVALDVEDEFNNMPFRATAGVRYEHTQTTSRSEFNQPIGLAWISPTELRPIVSPTETVRTAGGSYDNFLPAVDMSLEFLPDTLLRLSYGRTLSRNDLLQLRSTLGISDSRPGCNTGASCRANQGNPALLPYVSDNFDASLEKYFGGQGGFFGKGSYAAVNYFRKYVGNYVVFNTIRGPLIGGNGQPLTDPTPPGNVTPVGVTPPINSSAANPVAQFDITTPVNGKSAKVNGWEFATQLIFGESGFGMQANYTKVNGDIGFDKTNIATQVALTGLSDSFNLVGFFEKWGLQARVAYNWRGSFLLSTEQLRQPQEPVFVNSAKQVDASLGYDITKNFTVFVEGVNLFNETSTAHGRFDNQFVYAVETGPRYTFGIRGKF
jgi:iron complex outermembrane recepter protein